MSFSKTLTKVNHITPEKGKLKGVCCICGTSTDEGHKLKFSANFTSATLIHDEGDVICPDCYFCVKNSNSLRRTMFLLTESEYKPFKKQEIKEVIFNLPKTPFYLYLTKTWQKIGWIQMNKALNTGNDETIKVVIDYDLVNVNINNLKHYYSFIQELREYKISKPSLENGELTPHQFKRIVEHKNREYARRVGKKLKELSGNPEFLLAIYIVD